MESLDLPPRKRNPSLKHPVNPARSAGRVKVINALEKKTHQREQKIRGCGATRRRHADATKSRVMEEL